MDLPLREAPTLPSPARGGGRVGVRKASVGTVRRRDVIYVAGYEPRGAKGYGKLFERECDRFQRVWPVSLTIEPTDLDSEDFARWLVDVRASHWQVSTTYDFLRLERFIRSDLNEPMVRHIPRSLGWVIGDLVSGALLRIFLASWRFGLHLLFVQLVLLTWLAFAAAIGATAGYVVTDRLGLPAPVGIVASLLAALASFLALPPGRHPPGGAKTPGHGWALRRRSGLGVDRLQVPRRRHVLREL